MFYMRQYSRLSEDEPSDSKHVEDMKNSKLIYKFMKFAFRLFIFYSYVYRVSQEERAKLGEGVPYVKLYGYNPKHLYPKLNGYGDNGHRKVWASGVSTYCTPSVTPYSFTAHARQRDTTR